MTHTFHQVSLTLRSDHWVKSGAVLLSGFILLGAWTSWAYFGRLSQVELSDSARLEVRSVPASVQANFDARISAVHMSLGQVVHTGDILLEGDTQAEQLAVQEQIARQTALLPRIAALRSQIAAERAGSGNDATVLHASSDNAQAEIREAETDFQLAEKERDRTDQLKAAGIISEAEAQRAVANAESKRAALDALRHSLTRLNPEYQLRQGTRQAHIDELLGEEAALEGELSTAQAERRRLEYEIERKIVRAPASGRLAECLPVSPGAHVSQGDKLGEILPAGDLHIVAEFAPSSAFGKVHPGQNASVRLDGFPWAQYGVVHARVSNVATEIRDGKVRVELSVVSGLKSGLPLQHGLPGSVEIETERISPLALLLRTAGNLAANP